MRKFIWLCTLMLGFVVMAPTLAHAGEVNQRPPLSKTTIHKINQFNQHNPKHQFFVRIISTPDQSINHAAMDYFNHQVDDPNAVLLYITRQPNDYQIVLGKKAQMELKAKHVNLIPADMAKLFQHKQYNQVIAQMMDTLNHTFNQSIKPKVKKDKVKPKKMKPKVEHKPKHERVAPTVTHRRPPKPPKGHTSMGQVIFALTALVIVFGLIIVVWSFGLSLIQKGYQRHSRKHTFKANHQDDHHSNKQDRPVITLKGRH